MNTTKLTQREVEKIQFDEGVIFLDYGLATQRLLAPMRGGGEFSAKATIRDIEFDGRVGKTAGMQVIEEQEAAIKATTLCMSQDALLIAMPFARVTGNGDTSVIKNPKTGLIPESAYPSNATMFVKTLDGKYKRITVYRPLNEDGLGVKAVPKAEGELALNLIAHYCKEDLDGDLWEIKDVSAYAAPLFVCAETTATTTVAVTFNNEMSSDGLVAGDFTVLQSDANKAVSAAVLSASNAKVVELTVATLSSGKTITVSYTKGTTKNTDGVALETFDAQLVTNSLT